MIASWVVPIVVTMLNVLLVVGVSAGPRAALLVLCLMLVGAGVFLARRLRAHPSRPVAEPANQDGPFTEDLDLTLWVGGTAEGDRVLERRSTRSARVVEQRALTLISPFAGSDAEKISITPRVQALNAGAEASWMPLDDTGRGVVHFMPVAEHDELQWEISYTVNGLWDPLRTIGLDTFRYDVRAFSIGEFTIRFIFDAKAAAVSLQERNRRGTVGEAEMDSDGNWLILWRADKPATAARYEFGLRVDWGGDAHSAGSASSSRPNRNEC
ncbi:hypothetical protein OHA21_18705 [Actinoplanes sp. NBC_00393]|uniref:hypothetical protein n=1 Tax=Actinoplanes sp. NBC_00393 TaxID=2975953 RepID=UPI002E2101D2